MNKRIRTLHLVAALVAVSVMPSNAQKFEDLPLLPAADPTDQLLIRDVSVPTLKTITTAQLLNGVGLKWFVEASSTDAPNATIPAYSFAATGAAANIDAVFKPKGTGSFLASIPDGLAAGGNKRGASAVDLQLSRTAATQVAAGIGSVIGGGANNTVSSQYGIIPGGSNNSITAPQGSGVFGMNGLADSSGQYVFSNGQFTTAGDAQTSIFVQRASTTSATAGRLAGGTTAVVTSLIQPRVNGAVKFNAMIVAKQSGTTNCKVWTSTGIVKMGADASTIAFMGTPTVTVEAEDAGSETWTVNATVNTSNGSFSYQVIGEAGKTIRWVARIDTVEVR